MKTDRLTKVLLGIIAIALWMIALNPWLRPVHVAAQGEIDLGTVESYLSDIQSDVSSMESYLRQIQRGTCSDDKLC